MKLFIFYLGGSVPGANIEVHDVQFAVARQTEDAYPALAARWFGTRDSLHIDAYGVVEWADGFRVTLEKEKPAHKEKLYFINMGGYKKGDLREEHEFAFLVAETADQAKSKAKNTLLPDHSHRHKDNLMEVDDCIPLEQIGGFYIHLTHEEHGESVTAEWQGYRKI
ncbi:hypothetical protein GKA01_20340 [Gluconobacter kanchanaburiensis NBRC 103587]|uniref:DUF1543 domain-containing protein n=2 Tax=Gluconobacter kanchanaburiensis TaxID=563199 RepID=A0A511BGA4_9PROT|nr:DUF1543 domain-containing protein [Gluconobacter kanchanaburiensis]GBR71178.1 hypothetical protein AA103587_2270 [Gluconobacter kanchanaburiensis NBRC 103587]GEK96837.1 hypothetical protein GKA01_20340 [Gluconobacter kanchanaburiensis NBRC 103587]